MPVIVPVVVVPMMVVMPVGESRACGSDTRKGDENTEPAQPARSNLLVHDEFSW
jgi:hypothetical protein